MRAYILQSWDRWGVDSVIEGVFLDKAKAERAAGEINDKLKAETEKYNAELAKWPMVPAPGKPQPEIPQPATWAAAIVETDVLGTEPE